MGDINKSVGKIRKECDNIEENIKPKKAKTCGDPIVVLNDWKNI